MANWSFCQSKNVHSITDVNKHDTACGVMLNLGYPNFCLVHCITFLDPKELQIDFVEITVTRHR